MKCVVVVIPSGKDMTSLDGSFYTRVGNTDQGSKCDGSRSASSSDRGVPRMDRTCRFTKEDLSEDSIEFFVKNGKKHGRISDSVDPKDIDGILSSYDLVIDGRLTLSAGILFGREPRRLNDGAFLKIGEFDEKGILRREDYVEVPSIQIPDEAMRILYERYIPSLFGYGDLSARRSVVDIYPKDAVRELLVNAVVHKDYRVQEPITVAVYPDHMEIASIGGLPTGWTPDDLLRMHTSVRRNNVLATVFHDAGFMEGLGRGIGKVIAACESNGNPLPEFFIATGALFAVLHKREVIDCDVGMMGAVVTTDAVKVPSGISAVDIKQQIIGLILKDPHISASEMGKVLSLSSRTVERYLSKLKAEGKVKRDGNVKSGKWEIVTSK